MSDIITITANWNTGSLSSRFISRQYDNNRYRIQFMGYPEDVSEDLIFYLLVWMRTDEAPQGTMLAPIQMDSDQWMISNYFTQKEQQIKFQLCIQNESGTFEAHSPIFNGSIQDSLEHDGEDIDIDTSALFDYYREYVNNLIIQSGAVVIDSALSASSTNPVQNKAVAAAFTEVNERLESLEDGASDGVPTEVREAIYDLFSKIPAYTSDPSASRTVLASWKAVVISITLNVSTASISGSNTTQLVPTTVPANSAVAYSSSDASVATVSASGLVTGVGNGTCTITASSGGKTARCTVTVSGFATLSSITAVYTPSGMVYDTDTLDSLKSNLVVTGTYSDSSTATITNYTLSGTLTEGTRTITVSYGGKTTTFNVTVVHQVAGWLYQFEDTLQSSGVKDFGFQGPGNYITGANGTGKAYSYVYDANAETNQPIYAVGATDVPDLSGDFTIAYWWKTDQNLKGQGLSAFDYVSSSVSIGNRFCTDAANQKSGYSIAHAGGNKEVKGFRCPFLSSKWSIRLIDPTETYVSTFNVTMPSGFDSTQWHHYAITRSGTDIYVFVDGEIIFTATSSYELLWASQCSIGGYYATVGQTLPQSSYGSSFDDVYIAESCKWTANFDPAEITY